MKKDFDRLEWSFIRSASQFFNFPNKTICLIMNCITTVSCNTLINGSPTLFFYPTRGIRQEDTLSTYFFIICVDYLSYLTAQAVKHKKGPLSISPKMILIFPI